MWHSGIGRSTMCFTFTKSLGETCALIYGKHANNTASHTYTHTCQKDACLRALFFAVRT